MPSRHPFFIDWPPIQVVMHEMVAISCAHCRCRATQCDCEITQCGHCNQHFLPHGGCTTCRTCRDCYIMTEHQTCRGCGSCASVATICHQDCGNCSVCVSISAMCYDCNSCSEHCTCPRHRNYIDRYNAKAYPLSKPPEDSVPKNFLYLGVELETECQKEETLARNQASQVIHEKFQDSILQKEDGSLDCGIELVTGKLSLEEHKKLWPEVCQVAVASGLRSWKYKSTGLHVHMSRRFFTPLTIGKLLVFINSDKDTIEEKIYKLAGRRSSYGEISKKKMCKRHIFNSKNRYEAVNLTNEHTIEIRIFKGTLKATRVLAAIEFCHASAHWVTQCSIRECESWTSFWLYVKKQGRLYRNLINFFEPESILPIIVKDEPEETDRAPAPQEIEERLCVSCECTLEDDEIELCADCSVDDDNRDEL